MPARVMERNSKLAEAAQTWERIADEYSDNEQVPDALFLAGIARYRLNDYRRGTDHLPTRSAALHQTRRPRPRSFLDRQDSATTGR